MRKILFAVWSAVLVCLLVPQAGLAQEGRTPVMVVQSGDQSKALKLSKVQTEVTVRGYLAETRMTMTFYNPASRAVAGDLHFPLPEGSVVSGYALDIKGSMVDGVVVDKDKGRQVFEKEVRRGIDPGLVEWVKGNNFQTRVFPIPARGSRTVMVRYLSELGGPEAAVSYYLPLKFPEPVDQFSLRVEVVQPQKPPQVEAKGLSNFSFKKWRQSFVAETALRNQALDTDLIVSLPQVERRNLVVERDPDGWTYFCINQYPPKLPAPDSAMQSGRMGLIWDASASRGAGSHERELAILKAVLAHKDLGVKQVDLVVFRNKAEKTQTYSAEQGGFEELIKRLGQVSYDGGTQMEAVSPEPGAEPPDFYLMFSDGLSTFGRAEPKGFKAPVYVISGDAASNHPFLRYLAHHTGGDYFNLSKMEDREVVDAVNRPAYSFISVTQEDGISQTYPRVSQPVHGRFSLAGRLTKPQAAIRVNYGWGGRIKRSELFVIKADQASKGSLLSTFWAQKKIDELAAFPELNAEPIKETGKAYGLVTPGTSLIVLESLEQYVRHRIEPPQSLAQMHEQYLVELKRLERKEAAIKQRRKSKLDQMAALWQQRIDWWEQDFEYPEGFKYRPKEQDQANAGGVRRQTLSMEAAPMAAPPPPARPAANMVRARAARAPSPHPAPVLKSKALQDSDGDSASPAPPSASIKIKAWDPKTPYLDAIKSAPAEDYLKVYLEQRREYAASPAFYLDCASFFFRQKEAGLALRALSSIAELKLESPPLMRIVAHMLAQNRELELARVMFEKIKKLRPEEPQSDRDLALVHDLLDEPQKAVELLYQVVTRDWDRFEQIELIALMEMNRVIGRALGAKKKLDLEFVDPRLIKLLDLDVRIVLTWDADLTDMDLWVIEPSGEKAFYSHPRTTIGGLVSRDFTQGYGPEEYLLKKAMPGDYQIQVKYFASHAPMLAGAVTLQVTVFSNYGRKDEKRQELSVRLRRSKDMVPVGTVSFK